MAHVQTKGLDAGSVTSSTIAFASNNGAGNLIVALCRYSGTGHTITVTDTNSNTYQQAGVDASETNGGTLAIFYAMNVAAGANTVQYAISGSAVTCRWTVSEFSGVATSTANDKNSTGSGASSSTPATGSVTPTTDGQLLICGCSNGASATYTAAGTDFTIPTNGIVPAAAGSQRVAVEYYIQPTAAAHTGSFTEDSAQSFSIVLATFKAAGSIPSVSSWLQPTTGPYFFDQIVSV